MARAQTIPVKEGAPVVHSLGVGHLFQAFAYHFVRCRWALLRKLRQQEQTPTACFVRSQRLQERRPRVHRERRRLPILLTDVRLTHDLT